MASLTLHYENRHQIRAQEAKLKNDEKHNNQNNNNSNNKQNRRDRSSRKATTTSTTSTNYEVNNFVGGGAEIFLATSPVQTRKSSFKSSTTPTPTNVLVNRVNKPTIETVVAATTAANLGHTTNYMNTAMCSSSSPKKSPLDVTTGGMSAAAAANAATIHNIARANSIQSSSNTSTTIPIQTSPTLERKYHQQQQQHHYYQGHHHHTHHHSPVPVLKSGGMACPPPQNLKSATAYSSAGPYIVASNNHINGDAYHDKISDAKFFSRNYRVKPNEQAMAANERQSLNMSVMDIYHQTGYYQQQQQYNHQTSPSLPQRKVYTSYGDREASKMSFYSQANTNYQTGGGVGLTATPASNTVAAATATVNNKLKLLKKRNALKKSLSNAAGALVGVEGDDGALDPSPIGGPVAYETTLINSTGREDYRSQNSLNKASVYLSRNSLNTAATNLDYYKSNDTLNNSHNYNGDEYTGKNLSRVKSTPHINQIQATGNIQHSAANIKLNQTQRTRSENEISNLSDSYRLKKTGPGSNGNLANQQKQTVHLTAKSKDHLATTTTTTTTNTEATTTPMTVRKEDEYQHHFKVYLGHAPNNNSASAANSYQQTHNYSQHTISMSTRAAALHAMNSNSPLELFDASPYNIMSDPVICEQFRKLYEEDEYFQNVHKKCVEWLNKYVFADYDS